MHNPLVFILSWQRPLYLWACLDSLYRNTRIPCRFVLLENASTDPLVGEIVRAFEAREMFYKVHWRKENHPDALAEALEVHAVELGEYFCYLESDVLIAPSQTSWLQHFIDLSTADPQLAIVGSLVDKTDFVDMGWAKERFPSLDSEQLEFLIKAKSPERRLQDHYDEPLIDPFNPPGRLLFLKTEFIKKAGILRDKLSYETAKQMGYRAAISTRVRHRHLSFQNLFDYPESDLVQRNAFWKGLEGAHGKR